MSRSAVLNGRELKSFYFPASELLKGGSLILEMGPEPDTRWGVSEQLHKLPFNDFYSN